MNGIEYVLDTSVALGFLDGEERVGAFWRLGYRAGRPQ